MTDVTEVASLCAYCGVGCGMVLQVGQTTSSALPVITKTVGRKDHPTNFGRLCTKGSTTADMLAAPGRMDKATMRVTRGADRDSVSLDEAIDSAAGRLRTIIDEHGPDSVALYVSGQMSLESQYLSNKLAKGFLRTPHIESNSRLCMASAGTGYKQSLGADGPPGSYQDFDTADLFLVIGSNMADCHPILFLRMMERVKAGAKLVVVDPRRTATADKADLYLQVRPGTDLALLNGLLHLLIANDTIDHDFIAEFTDGFDALPDFVADYPPAEVERITGVAAGDIETLARWIGEAPNWMSCWTMGLNQSTHGTWNTNAICNLHLATGAICRVGSGPFSLTGQPNAMGGREMGYMGPGLPGQRSVLSESDRDFVEDNWGLPRGTIRSDVGPGTIEMFDKMAAGEIKACWIICTNPVASVANRSRVIEALRACELVIVQDVFSENETTAYADITFPAAMWTESDGVMVNSERNLTLYEAAVPAPGDATPDWELITRVASAMGFSHAFDYTCSEEIFTEIKKFWNPLTGWDIRGVTYDLLHRTPVQWPCPPDADDDRHPVRYLNDGRSQRLLTRPDGERPRIAFPTPNGRAVFHTRPHLPPAEMPDDEYPFVLNTGRLQHQWHTMTKTGRVAKLNKLNPGPFVEIHPDDGVQIGVREGDSIQVTSRRGSATLPAVLTDRVRAGTCFTPFHWSDMFGEDLAINAVTNDAVDPHSLQPEFKACAVTLTLTRAPKHDSGGTVQTRRTHPETTGSGSGIADLLGLVPEAPPSWDPVAHRYLSGLMAGISSATVQSGVPVVPATAPLDESDRAWVNGVLAGAFSRVAVVAEGRSALVDPARPDPALPGTDATLTDGGTTTINVLWASQTGTVEDYAPTVVEALAAAGLTPRLAVAGEAGVDALVTGHPVLILTSTTGDGDPPDNAADLWIRLAAEDAPSLSELRYSVLAFGDPSYDEFCGFGRRLDDRLTELGARRLADRADCEPDFDDTAATWLAAVTTELSTTPAAAGTPAPATAPAAATPPAAATAPAAATSRPVVNPAPVRGGASPSYGRRHPLRTRLTRNRRLTGGGSQKDVRQLGFALPEGSLTYRAGDALGVMPRNAPGLVENILELTHLDGSSVVTVAGHDMELRTALRERLDITRVSRGALVFVADHARADDLTALLAPDNAAALDEWMWGRQLADVLSAHPVRASAADWLEVLKPLTPRQYSISSSPAENPCEVQLTVSAVRYNVHGVPRHGVCSTYLADHADDEEIGVWVSPSAHFGPPTQSEAPMIMIGPGTGIAPFRGFLYERRALGHTGKNWLFFGEQHAATDFYYRDEIEAFHSDGHLTELDLAFSRDQDHKIYVQDRMMARGAQLWEWLNDGAHLYVCGDKNRMARDVDDALTRIVAQHGRLSGASAESYVKALLAEKRYVRDVY